MSDSKISFWFVPPEIASLDLPLLESSILGVVYGFTRNGGECWATDKQFATAFGCGERTIERAMSRLYLLQLLMRTVERKPNGFTPRRLFLTLPYRQIDATPSEVSAPYRQIDATLPPNWPDPTVKMTLPYRHSDAQIVINKNKDNVSKDNTSDLPPPHISKKTEVESEIESGIKESLRTESESENEIESQNPSPRKARRKKDPKILCPSPADWLSAERLNDLKAKSKNVPTWSRLSNEDLDTAIKNMAFEMYVWSTEKGVSRPGWDATFMKWMVKNSPQTHQGRISYEEQADKVVNELFGAIAKGDSWNIKLRQDPILWKAVKEFGGAHQVTTEKQFTESVKEQIFRSMAIRDIKKIYRRRLVEG